MWYIDICFYTVIDKGLEELGQCLGCQRLHDDTLNFLPNAPSAMPVSILHQVCT